jgi:hypothetical protein
MHSWQGDTVLDPFAGTGTTSAAAASLARSSVAMEYDGPIAEESARWIRAPETVDVMRTRSRTRLERHRTFLDERTKPCRHRNARYGFDVVTSQETDLAIPVVDDVAALESSRSAGRWEVSVSYEGETGGLLDPD